MNTKAKKILKVIGIIILVIVLTLAAYIIYLYASYHRIEDNKELQVETISDNTSAGDPLTAGKNTPHLHITSASVLIPRISVSLWTGENIPGQRARIA